MHDFATFFSKLRPTTRRHNNKTEAKREKETNTADQKMFHSTVIFKNASFPEPPGVDNTPKNILNDSKSLSK